MIKLCFELMRHLIFASLAMKTFFNCWYLADPSS